MHCIISATMRITLATLMLLGVSLFVLLGLLSLIRELFADGRRSSSKTEGVARPINLHESVLTTGAGATLDGE